MSENNIFSELIPDKYISKISFSIDNYKKIIQYLGLSTEDFIKEWNKNKYKIDEISNSKINYDWVLAICLPLISYSIKQFLEDSKPRIIGISALPGSGKSTLGYVLEKISETRNFPIDVISIDDFYLPADDLDKAMKGNPWNAPRGLPGSHSLDDMHKTMDRFIDSGELIVPKFDKSLRYGSGDRSGWYRSYPKVLVIEGWFLGCNPLIRTKNESSILIENLEPKLSLEEKNYRIQLQESLFLYLPIWAKISKLFHIRAQEFNFTNSWKREQENNMFKIKGSSLSGNKLDSFIRMISTCIPQESLQSIYADITININLNREIQSIDIKS